MSYVDVLAVEVLDNPAKYTDDLRFKITFQCKQKTLEGCRPPKARISSMRKSFSMGEQNPIPHPSGLTRASAPGDFPVAPEEGPTGCSPGAPGSHAAHELRAISVLMGDFWVCVHMWRNGKLKALPCRWPWLGAG
jgi:hypothetical protein